MQEEVMDYTAKMNQQAQLAVDFGNGLILLRS